MKSINPFEVWIKFVVAFIACLVIRLVPVPFRAPNVEPIMATMMPFARSLGAGAGFFFAFFSMIALDVVMVSVGQWTLVTAVTYGLIGAFAPVFFKHISGVRGYVAYAVLGTLVFDCITGVFMGPLLFGQSFTTAFVGQIPFTAMHLAGNITFALTISPILEKWIVGNSVPVSQLQRA